MQDNIQLTRNPLDVAAAAAAVVTPDAGGINIFLGTTRAESGPAGNTLRALEYHAYDAMALKEIEKIVLLARDRWPIHKTAVWHRLGEVPIGHASIVIAVSCPHRAESFAACQFIIDELKKTVPIWKRELFADASRWQEPPPKSG